MFFGRGNDMSVSYWISKRFGVLITLFYMGVIGVLIVSHYKVGVSEPGVLARYYPPGRTYESSDKYQIVRDVYGFSPELSERISAKGGVDVLSYTDDGVVIQRSGKKQETVSTGDAIKYLANPNTAEVESYVSPLYRPLNELLDLHLKFLRRAEEVVGGEGDGLTKLIVPKAIISAAYLGLVCFILYVLKRVDKSSGDYKGGYSLIYASFVFWPIAIIVVSFFGTNVVDVVRHLPDSYFFLRNYIVGAWAALFAWPLFVIAISILDIIHAALWVDLNRALAHAAVLALGVISVPLVTVGVLFAILVAVLYTGYRATKKLVLPAALQRKR